jgi:serine/threonine protein kinase
VTPAFLGPGLRLGRYELIAPIGSGGSGAVYEALDTASGKRVAVKVCHLPREGELRRRTQARFEREARAASRIEHPNAVAVFEFGIDGGLVFLAMELVDGETLARLLAREDAIPVERAAALLLPIFSAVAALHAGGVIHRDIKPANILLGRAGSLSTKLADFGLSRFTGEPSSLTVSGAMLGTLDYMAPEVTRHASEATDRSDQYSLAVVLYECVTGRKPFVGENAYQVMHATVRGDAAAPSRFAAGLPPGFDAIVLRAMNREPQARFGSVDEFAAALRKALPGQDAQEPPRSAPRISARAGASHGRARWSLQVHDGVAMTGSGDTLLVLWEAPASMSRVLWTFDATDRFARAQGNHIVVLVILLPSSSPPDAETTLECMRRINRLRASMRRQATVAIGGKLWRSIIGNVFRAMKFRRGAWLTLSATLDDGVGALVERRGPATPSVAEIHEGLSELYEALELPAPAVERAPDEVLHAGPPG